MEPSQIALASVPKIDGREWLPGNPWTWMGLGLLCCTSAWLWMALAGSSGPELRYGLVVAGLLSIGAALAIRWNFAQPSFLGRISLRWRSGLLLSLSALFHLLAVGVSVLLIRSFLWPEVNSWRWGPLLVCWIVVAPMSTIAGIQCYRRMLAAETLDGREEAALLLLLAVAGCQAAVGALFDRASPLHLDTIRFFLGVVSLIGLAVSPLVLVPATVRRKVVSLLIVLHFASVGAAALSFQGSQLIHQFTSRLSRPYLDFFSLGNPHHYFAAPGQPSQLWFRIIFEDAAQEWFKLPDVDGHGNHTQTSNVNLTRCICLVEQTTLASSPGLFDMNARPTEFFRVRLEAARPTSAAGPDGKSGLQIPFLSESELPVGQQCQMPNHVNVRRLLKSYVLHLVGAYQRDGRKVKAVKVYRVRHQSLSLQEYRKGIKEPWDPDTFVSVYMGDFDTHGEPLNLSSDLALPVYIASSVGLMCPALGEGPMPAVSSTFCPGRYFGDPFLYWVLPTVRDGSMRQATFRCYTRKHAGDPAWIRNAEGKWVEGE